MEIGGLDGFLKTAALVEYAAINSCNDTDKSGQDSCDCLCDGGFERRRWSINSVAGQKKKGSQSETTWQKVRKFIPLFRKGRFVRHLGTQNKEPRQAVKRLGECWNEKRGRRHI